MTDATSSSFVHLHVHSEYSLMDGMMRIKDIVQKAKSLGHSHIALTDHGSMYGAVDFFFAAKAAEITPIVGCEIYCLGGPQTMGLGSTASLSEVDIAYPKTPFHLVLLAKNTAGYKKLIKIVSSGYVGENSGIPISKDEIIEKVSGKNGTSDLVCLSACQRGELGYLVGLLRELSEDLPGDDLPLALDDDSACGEVARALRAYVEENKARFPGDFYVEIIDNAIPGQRELNRDLMATARHFDLPLIATSDAHYLNKDQGDVHSLLTAIKNSLTKTDIRERLKEPRFHMTDEEEMRKLFADAPEALANTLEVAAKCSGLEIETGKYYLPKFDDGTGASADESLVRFSQEGLEKRLEDIRLQNGGKLDAELIKEYQERLDYELGVIKNMGFPGYFLIVQDFINWAKEQDIPVGPGRGSGAGSLVAYALRITDLDPIPYNLIFERFLNPDRVSMPDFDIDFCQSRRDEVIQYVTEHYGGEQVAQIATFGKLQAKGAIKSVGRALNMGYSRVDRFTKLFPDVLDISLAGALEQEPKLAEEMEKDESLKEVWDYATKIEGLTSHTSVHAAGVVISDGPISDYVPIFTTDGEHLITQYEMKKAEQVGLVKFDFLGLKTLTVIHTAVALVHKSGHGDFDISQIPMDDKRVFDQVSTGSTCGIFQLESGGFTALVKKLKPNCFEDIIALVALFRPGPLGSGMVDDFVARKHGEQEISYPHPELEPILKETYGMIIYQEQVQKIAAVLANYTLGEADLLRRAMGKKIASEMEAQKARFLSGAEENGLDAQLAEEIFDLMAEFANYGFNKSHSAAYGYISYQTAYLKVHFPEEYMAAIMTCDLDITAKIVRYVEDCRKLGIEILPLDINRSKLTFDVPKPKKIGFGLAAIKGVGENALKPIVEERDVNGPFASLTDLATRVDLGKSGKKTLELLIQAGALDSFGLPRKKLLSLVKEAVDFSVGHFHAKKQGQRSLFDAFSTDSTEDEDSKTAATGAPWEGRAGFEPDPDVRPYELDELYSERKLVGVFLSGHPLDFYAKDFALIRTAKVRDFPAIVDRASGDRGGGRRQKTKIAIIALLSNSFERRTKTGKLMASFKLEQQGDFIEAVMFEEALTNAVIPPTDTPVVAYGAIDRSFDGSTIRFGLERMVPLEEVRQERAGGMYIDIAYPAATAAAAAAGDGDRDRDGDRDGQEVRASISALRQTLGASAGPTPYRIRLNYADCQITVAPDDKIPGVELTDALISEMRQLPFDDLSMTFVQRETQDDG